MPDPSLDDVLTDDYLAGLEAMDVDELRRRRDDCRHLEAGVSYARRVVQGQLDILRAEAQHRLESGRDVTSVLAALPDLLGSHHQATAPANARVSPVVAPSGTVGEPEPIDDVAGMTDDELEQTATRLGGREADLSAQRRQLFERIDRLQDELAGRYKSGAASVSDAIRRRL